MHLDVKVCFQLYYCTILRIINAIATTLSFSLTLFCNYYICILFCRVGKQLEKTFSRCSDHLNVQSNIQTTSTSNDAGHSLLAVSKQMFSNFCPCWDIDCEQMGREREGGKEKQGEKERGGGSEWTGFTPLLMGFLQKVSHL